MKSGHYKMTQIVRHIIQLAAFILVPALFVTVWHALGDVVTALAAGEFSVRDFLPQLITLVAVFGLTAVWGRFFCGYLCAFGALQELLYWPRKRHNHGKRMVSPRLDNALQLIKYGVLIGIVVLLWVLALPFDASLSPWGIFGMLTSGNWSVASSAVFTVGFVVLVVLMLGAVFIERFFCRYFCPLGASFNLVSGKRFYCIRRQTSACVNCGLCERTCSMGVPILKTDTVTSGKCINCMQCLVVCPKACLSANPAPAVAGTAAAVMMCGLVQVGSLTAPQAASAQSSYSVDTTSAQGNFTDGVYTGSGAGFRGNTNVQVTVENGSISDITVLSYEDDAEFFDKAQASVIPAILSAQSVDVSTVSGATFSSNGIINAVANALNVTAQENTSSTNQQQNGSNDAVSSASQNDGAASDQNGDLQTALSSLADGTYQGSGEGYRGTTNVSVTVANGQISDITILSYDDDAEFFNRAENQIVSSILNAQSLDVSTVSGATFSSNGILEAVADALGVTYSNANQNAEQGHRSHGDQDRFEHGGHDDDHERDFERRRAHHS